MRTGGDDFGGIDAAFAKGVGEEAHHCQIMVNPYDPEDYSLLIMYKRYTDGPVPEFSWGNGYSAPVEMILRNYQSVINALSPLYPTLIESFHFANLEDKWIPLD